jgi:hypothetical protein
MFLEVECGIAIVQWRRDGGSRNLGDIVGGRDLACRNGERDISWVGLGGSKVVWDGTIGGKEVLYLLIRGRAIFLILGE